MLFLHGVEEFHHLDGALGNWCTGAEDGGYAGIEEALVVLRRDNSTGDDHDVLTTEFLELFDELRKEGLVACGEGAGTHDVDVVLDGLLGCFGGSLEERSHIDVESHIGITCGDHLGAAVVTVLSHLRHHDTRAAAFTLGELVGHLLSKLEAVVGFGL